MRALLLLFALVPAAPLALSSAPLRRCAVRSAPCLHMSVDSTIDELLSAPEVNWPSMCSKKARRERFERPVLCAAFG